MYDLGNQVADAFRLTTEEQRRTVAERPEVRFPYSDLLGLNPDALLLASYLENEHPSVCNGARPKSKDWNKLLKLALSYNPVENQPQSVDNL